MAGLAYMSNGTGGTTVVGADAVADMQEKGWHLDRMVEVETAPVKPAPKKRAPAKKKAKAED